MLAWVISKTYDLQQKGIVRDNARSIGKEKKKGKRDDKWKNYTKYLYYWYLL